MQRFLPRVTALLLVLVCAACGGDAQPGPGADPGPAVQAPDAPRASAAILNAFLEAWSAEMSGDVALLLHATTRGRSYANAAAWTKARDDLTQHFNGLRADTLDSYARANEGPWELRNVLTPPPTLHFVTPDEYERAFAAAQTSSEWDTALRGLIGRYPGARDVRFLSAPGVSADGRQALVYAEWIMGARLGTGTYFLLTLEEGRWKLTSRFDVWVS